MSDLPNVVAEEMYEAGWTCDMHEPDWECDQCQRLYGLLAGRLRLRGLKTRDEMDEEAVANVFAQMLDYISVQPEGDLPLLGAYVEQALDVAFGEVADE